MLKPIEMPITSLVTGPIAKPFDHTNCDDLGNSLSTPHVPVVYPILGDHAQGYYVFATLAYLLNDPSNGILLYGTSATINSYSYFFDTVGIYYANLTGGEGNTTYVELTAQPNGHSTPIATALVGTALGGTMGVRFTGTGGTYDYYPGPLGNWKTGSATDRVRLVLASGVSFPAWLGNGTQPFVASNAISGLLDELYVDLLDL